MNDPRNTVDIRLENGIPMYRKRIVDLPEKQLALLKSNGNKITIYYSQLKFA